MTKIFIGIASVRIEFETRNDRGGRGEKQEQDTCLPQGERFKAWIRIPDLHTGQASPEWFLILVLGLDLAFEF